MRKDQDKKGIRGVEDQKIKYICLKLAEQTEQVNEKKNEQKQMIKKVNRERNILKEQAPKMERVQVNS